MDLEIIESLISNLGFPIIMVFVACYYIKYLTDNHKVEVQDLNKQYNEQIERMNEILKNNTEVMIELKTFIQENCKCRNEGE